MRWWVYNVLIAVDQLGNAVTGGNPDETISSRLGKVKRAQGGKLDRWTWYGVARPLDAMLEWIDPNHSLEAIEDDETDHRR